MYDLGFNEAAVTNQVPLFTPPPAIMEAAARASAARRGNGAEPPSFFDYYAAHCAYMGMLGFPEYGYYDGDGLYDVGTGNAAPPETRFRHTSSAVKAPPLEGDKADTSPLRQMHPEDESSASPEIPPGQPYARTKNGDPRIEEFNGRYSLPADQKHPHDVLLTPFVNYHGGTSQWGRPRGAPAPSSSITLADRVKPASVRSASIGAAADATRAPSSNGTGGGGNTSPPSAPAVPLTAAAVAAAAAAPEKECVTGAPTSAIRPSAWRPVAPAPKPANTLSWAEMDDSTDSLPRPPVLTPSTSHPPSSAPSPKHATPTPTPAPAGPTLPASDMALPAPATPLEGDAPARDRDGIVAPAKWQVEQRRVAEAAVYDDRGVGFIMPWDEPRMEDAPSLPGLEDCPRTDLSKCGDDGRPRNALRYVGGLDISFVKDTPTAVASVVILEYPSMKVLHAVMDHCEMDVPYIPGYLAFREVDPLRAVIAKAKAQWPEHFPQVFFVDGNGLLHPRRCGLATHLGVVIDCPTVGCAKNLLNVDGLNRDEVNSATIAKAKSLADAEPHKRAYPLVGGSGALWGYAAMTGNSLAKPIFISPGHRVSCVTALRLALSMAPCRVIEPIRQADLRSREYIRQHFGS
jgi:deoxyinosine 3'endonuclease (endonuclease V)